MDLNYILLSVEAARKLIAHLERCEKHNEDLQSAIIEIRSGLENADRSTITK